METVSSSRFLTHPLLGRLSLQSKLGDAGVRRSSLNPSENMAAYYVASLTGSTFYRTPIKTPRFVVHESTGTVVVAHTNLGDGSDTLRCLQPGDTGSYSGTSFLFEAMPYSFADMELAAHSRRLLYAACGSSGTRIVLLDMPIAADDPHAIKVSFECSFSDETAWQIAASPTGDSFVAASTRGLRLYQARPDGVPPSLLAISPHQASSEFIAAAFGRDERTIMGGKRDGSITFHDSRTRDSVTRLYHRPGVNVIRMVDDSRVLVRGLKQVGRLARGSPRCVSMANSDI